MHANNPQTRESTSSSAIAQGVRVALLARQGEAQDALREALRAVDAELVLAGDPRQLDPEALRRAAPQAVLVALDSVIETKLSGFDDVLFDDAVLAIYEEAELVLRRDAWENARWLRHLMAKLHRRDDVLPPRVTAPQDLMVETVEACIGSWMMPANGTADATDTIHVAELAEATKPAKPFAGVVLVLAGMGGPDALRQLLGALPSDFHQPVLIRQRLYGGHYDHLLRQLSRTSALPVQLAEQGGVALPGRAYLLPEGTIATADDGTLRFAQGDDDFTSVPPTGSTVLLLSGCETAQAEAAATWALGGASLVAQSPETCFDDAAARALLALGGDAAAPAALAWRLSAQA